MVHTNCFQELLSCRAVLRNGQYICSSLLKITTFGKLHFFKVPLRCVLSTPFEDPFHLPVLHILEWLLSCLSLYIFWAQSHMAIFCKSKHRGLCPQKIYKLRQLSFLSFWGNERRQTPNIPHHNAPTISIRLTIIIVSTY